MRLLVLMVVFAAACGPESTPFRAKLQLERGETQKCSSDACTGIPMSCAARVLVRIIDANDENISYFSECSVVPGDTDLCALGAVTLGDEAIPNTMVRIQFAVWPLDQVADCPKVEFDLHGRAKVGGDAPTPAIAGETYFAVGSSAEATVVLGCIDEEDLDAPACQSVEEVVVGAGVVDFDTNVSVSPTVQNLIVAVGEPTFAGAAWTMPAADTVTLERRVIAGIPVWEGPEQGGAVALQFEAAACIQVLEDGATGVANTLSCRPASPVDQELELGGVLVRKATQDLVQAALGGGFPPGGVVLGRILDHTGQPALNAQAVPTGSATVLYLSDDMGAITGGFSTTSSGAFLSLDAQFDTTWGAGLVSPIETAMEVEPQLGGRVTGKVTVIELQLTEPETK